MILVVMTDEYILRWRLNALNNTVENDILVLSGLRYETVNSSIHACYPMGRQTSYVAENLFVRDG